MASGQVALARSPRNGPSHLHKASRQVIPAFLQKLYEMVDSAASNDLIRWSDGGDSFYVLDHERFAREVLGRWFKHQNFSSFVRQLNMYGFHKVPHLQQGVLRSEPETEFWNFEHPNFHRGQPDLLCLIQRKKQITPAGDDSSTAADANRDVGHLHSPTNTSNLSPAQILDINSIVNGINAIKRHQTAISAELGELKHSNEDLWREVLAARERHKKHQDTINRILKFLAGVFGHLGSPVQVHKGEEDLPQTRAVVPRKGPRLMIAAAQESKEGQLVDDLDNDPRNAHLDAQFPRSQSPRQFTNVESPQSLYTSPDALESLNSPTPIPNSSTPTVGPTQVNPSSDSPNTTSTSPNALTFDVNDESQTQPSDSPHLTNSVDTALTAMNGSPSPEALQSVFNQALSNPVQLQQLLAALGSQPFPYSNYDPQPSPPAAESQLAPFAPHYDLTRNLAPNSSFSPFPQPSPPLPTNFEDSHLEPLISSSEHLHQTYKDATDVNKDVDALHTSLNSLIESLGLDPTLVNPLNSANSVPPAQDHVQVPNDPVPMTHDYDFDSLWSQITTDGATNLPHDFMFGHETAESPLERPLPEAAAEHFAYLDDASPLEPIVSQTTLLNENGPAPVGNRKKRKSEVSETDGSIKINSNTTQVIGGSTTPRAKRKR